MTMYDYIIVGAGPCGITLAYLLGKIGKKCILVDQNDSIGGCHRVKRVNGMFTEHSPRVYLSSYLNTKKLLKEMGSSFDSVFTPYHFSISYIASQLIHHLSFSENLLLANEFINLLYCPLYDRTISVQTFITKHGFSAASIDYLDRICRFSDGGGIDRYSMYQLLQLINQQLFYGLYQPKLPNDIGLLSVMQNALLQTGNVTILNRKSVSFILFDLSSNQVTGIQTQSQILHGHHVLLAVPPPALYSILQSSPMPIRLAFGDVKDWTKRASYNIDIAATFHWDTIIDLPIVWGFPSSEWGLISIPLTQYMDMKDDRSKTVISTCITYLDVCSTLLGKTANEITDPLQLITEMFRQLRETYPLLPPPTTSLLSPTVFRHNNAWVEQDSGFFKSSTVSYLSSSGKIPNLYQIGTQNGKSSSSFTTFEAAVTNAIKFVNDHEPKASMSISSPIELTTVIRWIFLVIILCILLFFFIRYMIQRRLRGTSY